MEEKKVLSAIVAITGELAKSGISKDRKNQQQGYAFRGIDDVYNELSGLLAKNKVVIAPNVSERTQVERQTVKGGTLFYTTVKVDYSIFSAEDGSNINCTTYGEAMDSADKATNKAMSAAYKYLCLQLFCIPTEGDNDADATTPDPVKPKAQKAAPAVKQATPAPATLEERLAKCTDFLKGVKDASLVIGEEKTGNIISRVQDILDELQATGKAAEYKALNDLINSKLKKG